MSVTKETRQIPVESDDSDDDLPPPLEDMSVLVNHIQQAKPQKLAEPEKKIVAEAPAKAPSAPAAATSAAKPATIKKGFFNKAPKTAAAKPAAATTAPKPVSAKPTDDIPLIAPTNPTQNSLKLDDVQKAMGSVNWQAPNFLQAMAMRPELLEGMKDPKMMEAVDMFAKNPHAAMEKYKDNDAVRKFMMSFADLMGTHMSNLAKEADAAAQKSSEEAKKNLTPEEKKLLVEPKKEDKMPPINRKLIEEVGSGAPSYANRPKIEEVDDDGEPLEPKKPDGSSFGQGGAVLEHPDPKVRDALADPGVRRVLDMLREGKAVELGEVARQSPMVAMKLRYLMETGLLNGQREPPK